MSTKNILKTIGAFITAAPITLFLAVYSGALPLFGTSSGRNVIGNIVATLMFIGLTLFFLKVYRVPASNFVYILLAGFVLYVVALIIGRLLHGAGNVVYYAHEIGYGVLLVGAVGSTLHAWKERLDTKYIYVILTILSFIPTFMPIRYYF